MYMMFSIPDQNEDVTSIDTLDMAVQRICKTSKDLRHEVDCFSYYVHCAVHLLF